MRTSSLRRYIDEEDQAPSIAIKLISILISIFSFMQTDAGKATASMVIGLLKKIVHFPGFVAKLPELVAKLGKHGAPPEKVQQAVQVSEQLKHAMAMMEKRKQSLAELQSFKKQRLQERLRKESEDRMRQLMERARPALQNAIKQTPPVSMSTSTNYSQPKEQLMQNMRNQMEALRQIRATKLGVTTDDNRRVLEQVIDTGIAFQKIRSLYRLHRAKARNRY